MKKIEYNIRLDIPEYISLSSSKNKILYCFHSCRASMILFHDNSYKHIIVISFCSFVRLSHDMNQMKRKKQNRNYNEITLQVLR